MNILGYKIIHIQNILTKNKNLLKLEIYRIMKTELCLCLFMNQELEEMYVYICLLNRGILKQDLKQGDTFYIDFLLFSMHWSYI